MVQNNMLINNLRVARINAGLTQKEVGKKLNSKQCTISAIESGKNYPRFDLFFAMCELYGVKPYIMIKEYIKLKVEKKNEI